LIAPYPYNSDGPEDFVMEEDFDISGEGKLWYARPQLFFKATFCPTGGRLQTCRHMEMDLVFFSKFEPIKLTPDSHIQQKGVPMLYEHGDKQVPTLHICPVGNVLGRVPLIPCFLRGNTAPTIPFSFRGQRALGRYAMADGRPDSGSGSKLYEVNIWMWKYGRAHPRGISVADAQKRRREREGDARRRGWETGKARLAARGGAGEGGK
jgi:hypothetical protein